MREKMKVKMDMEPAGEHASELEPLRSAADKARAAAARAAEAAAEARAAAAAAEAEARALAREAKLEEAALAKAEQRISTKGLFNAGDGGDHDDDDDETDDWTKALPPRDSTGYPSPSDWHLSQGSGGYASHYTSYPSSGFRLPDISDIQRPARFMPSSDFSDYSLPDLPAPPRKLRLPALFAAALNSFGLGLLRDLGTSMKIGDAGAVVSPLSLKMCLSMAAAGATEGSQTEGEFSKVIGEWDPDEKVEIGSVEVANSVWVGPAIQTDYKETIEKQQGGTVHVHRLRSAMEINTWVAAATKGRVTKLIETIPSTTLLLLVNTVFFKGMWSEPFKEYNTRPAMFHAFDATGDDERDLPCSLMYQEDKHMKYEEVLGEDGFQAVELPYKNAGLSATVLLPTRKGPEALQDLIQSLTAERWEELHKSKSSKHVKLWLPRFKLEFEAELSETLKALGLTTPFKGEEGGAFNRMTTDKSVYVNEVVHKAGLEVNEEGTVAYASTAFGGVYRSIELEPPKIYEMRVDRPFLFFVNGKAEGAEYDSRAVLFAAIVQAPKLEGISSKLGGS